VEWIAAEGITTQPGYDTSSNIAPGALIDGLVKGDVFSFLFAVVRSVRRKANTSGGVNGSVFNLPTVFWIFDIDFIPEF
jgi:hypothetical protein